MKFQKAIAAFILFLVNTRQEGTLYISLSKQLSRFNKENFRSNCEQYISTFTKNYLEEMNDRHSNKYKEETLKQSEIEDPNNTEPYGKNDVALKLTKLSDFDNDSYNKMQEIYSNALENIRIRKLVSKQDVESFKSFRNECAKSLCYALAKYLEFVQNEIKDSPKMKGIAPNFVEKAKNYIISDCFAKKMSSFVYNSTYGAFKCYNVYINNINTKEFCRLVFCDKFFIKLFNFCVSQISKSVGIYDPNYTISANTKASKKKEVGNKRHVRLCSAVNRVKKILYPNETERNIYTMIYKQQIFQIGQFLYGIKDIQDSNPDEQMTIFLELTYYDSIFLLLNEFFMSIQKLINSNIDDLSNLIVQYKTKLTHLIFLNKLHMFSINAHKTSSKIVFALGFDWKRDLNDYFKNLQARFEFSSFVCENTELFVELCRQAQLILCISISRELAMINYPHFEYKKIVYFPYTSFVDHEAASETYDITRYDFKTVKNCYNDKLNKLINIILANKESSSVGFDIKKSQAANVHGNKHNNKYCATRVHDHYESESAVGCKNSLPNYAGSLKNDRSNTQIGALNRDNDQLNEGFYYGYLQQNFPNPLLSEVNCTILQQTPLHNQYDRSVNGSSITYKCWHNNNDPNIQIDIKPMLLMERCSLEFSCVRISSNNRLYPLFIIFNDLIYAHVENYEQYFPNLQGIPVIDYTFILSNAISFFDPAVGLTEDMYFDEVLYKLMTCYREVCVPNNLTCLAVDPTMQQAYHNEYNEAARY